MNANGTWQANATLNGAWDGEPAWSPDGSKIAFVSERDGRTEIYVMNANGTMQTRLTNTTVYCQNYHPTWSLDGAYIAFESNRSGNSNIYSMKADGTELMRLTANQTVDWYPAWSPW